MSVPIPGHDLILPADARPRLATLEAEKQSLDSAAQAYARGVQEAVRGLLNEAGSFEDGWRIICRDVLAGKTAEMQAVRERFLGAFEARLRLLREALPLVQYAARVAGHAPTEAEQLEAEAEALERKLKKLAARWQTAEDLEDLAAESIELPPEKLEAIRRTHGYPKAWYDEDSKPF